MLVWMTAATCQIKEGQKKSHIFYAGEYLGMNGLAVENLLGGIYMYNNGFCGGNWCWIIILLILFCGCGNNGAVANNGCCDNNCGCC